MNFDWLAAYEAALTAGFDPHFYLAHQHPDDDFDARKCYTPLSCPTRSTELDEDGILQCEHNTLLESEWTKERNRWLCDLLMESLSRWDRERYGLPTEPLEVASA